MDGALELTHGERVLRTVEVELMSNEVSPATFARLTARGSWEVVRMIDTARLALCQTATGLQPSPRA